MTDHRNDQLEFIQARGRITVLKGGAYICEIMNSKEFGEVLCGYFHPVTGLRGDTLIELGQFVKLLENESKKDDKNEQSNHDTNKLD